MTIVSRRVERIKSFEATATPPFTFTRTARTMTKSIVQSRRRNNICKANYHKIRFFPELAKSQKSAIIFCVFCETRRDGRAVEGGRLEIVLAVLSRYVGSNPTLSAIFMPFYRLRLDYAAKPVFYEFRFSFSYNIFRCFGV